MRNRAVLCLWLTLAAFITVLPISGFGQQPLLTLGAGVKPAAGGCVLDTSTCAWIAQVQGTGGTVSGTQQTRVDTLITCLKSNSLFTVSDALWLYGGESSAQQAAIDIINLRVATAHGGLTLSAAGYTSDGSSGYIDSGFIPSTAGGNTTQNSSTLASYAQQAISTSGNNALIGGYDGTTTASEVIQVSGALLALANDLDVTLSSAGAPGGATTAGFWGASRTGATAKAFFKNNSSFASNASVSVSNLSVSIFLLARNNNGTADVFSSSTVSASLIAAGFNGTQWANYSTCLNGGYMMSWGINAY